MTVYTSGGTFGTLLVKPDGEMAAYSTPSADATSYTSLAAVSYPTAAITQHKLALIDGWTSGQHQYGTGGFSYAIIGGVVHLSGAIKLPSGTNNLCALLPPAARPAHVLYITVFTSSDTAGTLRILPNGDVFADSSPDASASHTLTSLAAISYPRNS